VSDAAGLDVGLTGGVLRIELHRPDRRNALDDAMVQGLIGAIERAGLDEDVRAVHLVGAGEHFCGGFDIFRRNAGDAPKPRVGSIQRRLPMQAHRLIPTVLGVQTPVVAEVRGWAVGIGLQLLLAADFAVVAEDAQLWEPFSERGFTPDSGATWLLPRRVGPVLARRMLMLGERISGAEAQAVGLVHQAVAPEDLGSVTADLLERLTRAPTVALGLTKWLLHDAAASDLETTLTNEALAMELSSRSQDFREGLRAYAERRPPEFLGR
jgi:2-(1,2-epoxy-1,2-dihydrophenyl)acetyl-CoA isomerase